jgi:hypothetical protein
MTRDILVDPPTSRMFHLMTPPPAPPESVTYYLNGLFLITITLSISLLLALFGNIFFCIIAIKKVFKKKRGTKTTTKVAAVA